MSPTRSPIVFRIVLQVSSLERAQRFYEGLLGAPGRSVGGGRVYFDCGPVILALLEPSGEGGGPPHPGTECVYFSTDELDAVHRRAQAMGCLDPGRIHGEDPAGEIVERPWGERSFYAVDPDGNPLCFVDASTLFAGREGTTGL